MENNKRKKGSIGTTMMLCLPVIIFLLLFSIDFIRVSVIKKDIQRTMDSAVNTIASLTLPEGPVELDENGVIINVKNKNDEYLIGTNVCEIQEETIRYVVKDYLMKQLEDVNYGWDYPQLLADKSNYVIQGSDGYDTISSLFDDEKYDDSLIKKALKSGTIGLELTGDIRSIATSFSPVAITYPFTIQAYSFCEYDDSLYQDEEDTCIKNGGTWIDGKCVIQKSDDQICIDNGGVWQDNKCEYKITYTLGFEDASLNGNPISYGIEDEITLKAPIKKGYTFIGWTGSNGETPDKNVVINKGTTGNLHYIAHWEDAVWTVSFIDETDKLITKYSIKDGGNMPDVPEAGTREGYIFKGWYKNDGTAFDASIKVYEDSTYKKVWTAIPYTITYHLNDGKENKNPAFYTIETETFTLNAPEKVGFTFTGWTGSNGDTPELDVTITKGSTGDLSYTANYIENLNTSFTVVYYVQDLYSLNYSEYKREVKTGTTNAVIQTKAYKEDIKGYTWEKAGILGEEKEYATISPDGKLVIEEYYTRNSYNVVVTKGDSNVESIWPNESTSAQFEESVKFIASASSGYTINNWIEENGIIGPFTTKEIEFNIPSNDIHLIVTTKNDTYVLTFNPQGGEVNPTQKTITYLEAYGELPIPTNPGYKFIGWFTEQTGGNEVTKDTICNQTYNITVHAHWEKETYVLTYDYDGGIDTNGLSSKTKNITYLDEYGDFPNVSKDYYILNTEESSSGWVISGLDVQAVFPASVYLTAGDSTIKPLWKPVSFTITYSLDGGTMPSEYETIYNIETETFTLKQPTKEDTTFIGWTGSNGNTPELTVTIPKGSTGDRKYTANWKKPL